MQNRLRTTNLFYEEPFRLFFPIGALLGVLAVVLWPLLVPKLTITEIEG